MIGFYYITTIITLIELACFIAISDRKVLFYNASFFVFSFLANLGYLSMALSNNVEEAVISLKITYTGGCTLTLFLFMVVCDLCNTNIHKIIRSLMWVFNISIFMMACSIGYTDFFYKSADIKKVMGVTVLVKEYAWGHSLFNIMLYGYMTACVVVAVIALMKKKPVSVKNVLLMITINFTTLIIHFTSKKIWNMADTTPLAYCVDNLALLYVTYQTGLHNLDEAYFNSIDKFANYGYVLLDKKLRFLGCNNVAKSYFPLLNDAKVDKNIQIVPGSIDEIIMDKIRQYDGKNDEFEIHTDEFDFLFDVQYLYHGNLKSGYIIEVSDDSERQNYIRRINQESANKSNFLSNVSHEIRTPINSILGMNEMILREAKDSAILDYASNIEKAGNTLLQLINDVLDLSRIESGKLSIFPDDYSLYELITEINNLIGPLANEKGLSFEIKYDENIPNNLYGDSIRIKQVLVNLLTNAVKYTDAGNVTFDLKMKKDGSDVSLIFAVSDSGRGIKQEEIEHLFNSFERVDEKKNADIMGTGLGLAITKQFIELMGGTIDVKSNYGSGTTFTVCLTQKIKGDELIKDAANKNGVLRPEYKESFKAPDARILVVDDNSMNLKVVAGLLKKTEINVDICLSGKECISMLKASENDKYSIIMLDHMMPEMDGVETLNMIKELGLAKGVPIVALTANAIGNAKEEYLTYGFDDYMSKPIVPKKLEELVMSYIPEKLQK